MKNLICISVTCLLLLVSTNVIGQYTTDYLYTASSTYAVKQNRTQSQSFGLKSTTIHIAHVPTRRRRKNKSSLSQRYAGIMLLKTSPIHLITGDIRLGYEHRLSQHSALEVEFGRQNRPLLYFTTANLTGVDPSELRTYTGLVRYKKFIHKIENTGSHDRRLQGLYVAPFVNVGNAIRTGVDFLDDGVRENQFIVFGVDLGSQSHFRMLNFDFFVGTGFTHAFKQEFGLPRADDSGTKLLYQNSHLAIGNVALRVGFRTGIDPFGFEKRVQDSKRTKRSKKRMNPSKSNVKRKKGTSQRKSLSGNINVSGEGFLIKVSPWHLLASDLRFGVEKRMNDFSTLEIEGGYQVPYNNSESIKTASLYNAIVRYKYFGNFATAQKNSKLIRGTYIAPFFNMGTSLHNVATRSFTDRVELLQEVNQYALIGLDVGFQEQYGLLNFDFFVGIGKGLIAPNKDFTRAEGPEIIFNNSHLSVERIGLRAGMRVGFDILGLATKH